jgi:hypothetical protein
MPYKRWGQAFQCHTGGDGGDSKITNPHSHSLRLNYFRQARLLLWLLEFRAPPNCLLILLTSIFANPTKRLFSEVGGGNSMPDLIIPREVGSCISMPDRIPREVGSGISIPDRIPREVGSGISMPDRIPREVGSGISCIVILTTCSGCSRA